MSSKMAVALAIVVFAAGLATGVILLQINVSDRGSGVSAEALELSNQHVWACEWVDQNGWAEAATVAVNTGETDVTIRKIVVRGIECDWSQVYFWQTDMGLISDELKATLTELSGPSFSICIDGVERTFHRANEGPTVKSGWTMILYIRNPIDLASYDGEGRIVITIFTDRSMYSTEALLDGSRTFTFMQTEQMQITSMSFSGTNNITLAVKNTGSGKVTITAVTVNGVAVTFTTDQTSNEWDAGETGYVYITYAWTSGNTYRVVLQSSTGTNVASYEKRAS